VSEVFDGVLGLVAGTCSFRMWVGTVATMMEQVTARTRNEVDVLV
jgi:hypothetical protein